MSKRPEPAVDRIVTPIDLLNIWMWSKIGVPAAMIAIKLGITEHDFHAMGRADPRVQQAQLDGLADGGIEMATALYALGAGKHDIGAIRFYLERRGGWNPARIQAPIVIVESRQMIEPDQEAMTARFARQRQLIDGTAQELTDEKGTSQSGE